MKWRYDSVSDLCIYTNINHSIDHSPTHSPTYSYNGQYSEEKARVISSKIEKIEKSMASIIETLDYALAVSIDTR